MALVLKDRIKESTVTTGTGTYTLSGAVTGFEAFSSVGDGNTTYYVCTDGTDFEVGIGTYTLSGTTLARTTILESSNSDSAVNWSAGTKTIFCSQPAEKAVFLNASDNLEIGGTAQINGTNGVTISTGAISIKNSGAQSYVDFYCESSNAHYARLLAPAHSAFAGNITLTLPATTQTLVGTAGAAFAGDVTFTGDNYNIVFDKSDDALEFADNAKAKFGAGGDLEIYHSGSGSFIRDAGTGSLRIGGSAVKIENSSFNETMMLATQNGAVELYYDNSKKLETASGGITVTGEVAATSLDISGDVDVDGTLEADAITLNGTSLGTIATQAADSVNIDGGAVDGITLGTNSAVTEAQIDNININGNAITSTDTNGVIALTPNGTGDVNLNADNVRIGDLNANASITTRGTGDLTLNTNSGTDSGSIVIEDGANGNISITPDGTGSVVIGGVLDTNGNNIEFGDSTGTEVERLKFGAGDDLQMYHDGSNSRIRDTGTGALIIGGSVVSIQNTFSTETMFKATDGGAVELYHDNSKKLETASGGITVTGEVAATSLDISGDVDVDGTLEADAITVNGTALNTVIADEATALAIALG